MLLDEIKGLHALTLVACSYVPLDEIKGLHALTLVACSYVPLDEIKGLEMYTVVSEAYHDWSGEAADAQLRVNFTLKLLLSQNFCNRPLMRFINFASNIGPAARGTCGTGSGAPGIRYIAQPKSGNTNKCNYWSTPYPILPFHSVIQSSNYRDTLMRTT